MEEKLVHMTVRVPKALKDLIKQHVELDTHINESEFVRDALREKIQRECPELSSRRIAGALTGISIRTKSLERERIFQSSWSGELDDHVYKIKSPYDQWIQEWISKREDKGA